MDEQVSVDDLRVVIPIPAYIPRARGIYATSILGSNIKVRVSRDERRLIEQEAERLGMSIGNFIRWVAYHTAEALRKRHEEHDGHTG